MIDWADAVFVMEHRHKQILSQRFILAGKTVTILDIEDHYQFNDPELIATLKVCLRDYL